MSRKLTTRDFRLLDQDEYGATSPVYRHIRDNYVDLVSHKVGSQDGPSWATVAQMLARRGHTNGRGQPLTADTVRKLFKRVALEVAKRPDQQPHKLEPTQHPSRQRPDWQPPLADAPRTAPALQYRRDDPEEALPPRRTSPLPPSQAPPASSKPKTIADLSPEGRAKIERLKRTLQEDDRKKFGHL